MDILGSKNYKSPDGYISRYAPFPYYYNKEDNKYMYGLTAWIKHNVPYVKVKVNQDTTLDGLANKYYGRPDYFWVIADFNHILDPFIQLSDWFTTIDIPNITSIEFED